MCRLNMTSPGKALEDGGPMDQSKPEQIIDTYVTVLAEAGVKQATIDAVAKRSGLSKPGLLHHYRSRADLDAALLSRLEKLVEDDLQQMQHAPQGAVHYYLSSSFDAGSPLEQAVVAATRLAQAGNQTAGEILRRARDHWYRILTDYLADPLLARMVLMAGDGVSYHTAIAAPDDDSFTQHTDISALTHLIQQLKGPSGPDS